MSVVGSIYEAAHVRGKDVIAVVVVVAAKMRAATDAQDEDDVSKRMDLRLFIITTLLLVSATFLGLVLPALMDRENPETRRTSLFWLEQQ
jgi:hypothetical protein